MSSARRLTVAVLLCALLDLPMWTAGSQAKGEIPGMFTSLYMMERQYGRILQPLNGVTLDDDSFMPVIPLGSVSQYEIPLDERLYPPAMIESPHGEAMAIIMDTCPGCVSTHPKYITVRVVSMQDGVQVGSFHPRLTTYPDYVSDDGKQIAGFGYGKHSLTWYVLATKTGKVLTATDLSTAPSLFDPASGRIYTASSNSQGTLLITAYALGSKRPIAQLTLSDVPDGTWNAKTPGGQSVPRVLNPGIALSPDGRHIAVLDSESDRLTIVDTPSLTVASTISLSRPQSWLERVAGFLGLLPQPALAKGPVLGSWLSLSYSHDGRALYATGWNASFDAGGQYQWNTIGLERIDAATGQITGQIVDALEEMRWWGEAADGSAIYTLSVNDPQNTLCPCTLRAHDPVTLQTTAERKFGGFDMVQLFIVG
jgi:hypothetical protein